MKTIKITQNYIGRFSLGSSERQHSFVMSIYEDGKIMKHNGNDCTLSFMVDEEESEAQILESDTFHNIMENMPFLVDNAFRHANRMISSKDYFGCLKSFIECYELHYDEINENMRTKFVDGIKEKIASLEKNLSIQSILPELSNVFFYCDYINAEISALNRRIKSAKLELADYKEGTKTYEDKYSYISKMQRKLDELTQLVTTKNENNVG